MQGAIFATIMLFLSSTILLAPTAGTAQPTPPPEPSTDPYQRYIIFYNELDFPIYPVIQAPNASNCNTIDPGRFPKESLLRIIVNDARGKGQGIAPKQANVPGKVRVNIPKDQPCKKPGGNEGGFYDAARIFIFTASVEELEARLAKLQAGKTVQTKDIPGLSPGDNLGTCPDYQVGQADLDYGHDAPAQLLEYTIISQIDGAKSPLNQNDPRGIS